MKYLLLLFLILPTSRLFAQLDNGFVAENIHQMSDYNLYPSYQVYEQMMQQFADNYPEICKLIDIGESVNHRKLLVLKISDNVEQTEYNEPEFFYSSTIHGNEICGFNLMLRLIDYLLSNYQLDSYVTKLIDNIQIYINPLANPDGLYYGGDSCVTLSTRYNANGVDLNRSFPTAGYAPISDYQPEVKAMIDFANQHYFGISANLHGGSEILNYPWDSYYAYELALPDDNWFKLICQNYINQAHTVDPQYMISSISNTGYVFGSEWYKIVGSRQDYMNFYHRCREITIELSNDYVLQPQYLTEYWNKNKTSLLNLIGESLVGITGCVTDISGNILSNAEIIVDNKDCAYTTVFTNAGGYFFRYLMPDSLYQISVYNDGYQLENQTVVVEQDTLTNLDFILMPGYADYPLPTADRVGEEVNLFANCINNKIVVQSSHPISNIVLSTINGRIIFNLNPHNTNFEYSLNNCSQGIYVLKTYSNGKLFTHKLFLSK